MKSRILTVLLLILFCTSLQAEIKIVTHDNVYFSWLQTVLDTKTGNVGIFYVTRNWSDQSIRNAYFALVGFNSSGASHVINKLKIGVNIWAGGICYNPKLSKFCVAYSIGSFPKSRIKLQFFDSSGKLSGNVEPFERNKFYDYQPLIIYNEKKDNYFLAWSRGNTYSLGWKDPLGLLATTLDADGKATGEIRSYSKVKETNTYQYIPEIYSVSLNKNTNKYYVLYGDPKVINYAQNQTSRTTEFITLNKKGTVVNSRRLGDGYTGGRYTSYSFAQIPETGSGKTGDTILAWVKEEKPYYQIIGPKGNKKTGFAINGMYMVSNIAVAHSDTQNKSILVFGHVSGGRVLARYLDASGRLTGQTKEIHKEKNNIMMTRALWNPKINKFVVLWTYRYMYKGIRREESLWITTID